MDDDPVLLSALWAIPSDSRDDWIIVGRGLWVKWGDHAFDLWDQWSRRSDRYVEKDMQAAWRSLRTTTEITPGSIIHLARSHGWRPEDNEKPQQKWVPDPAVAKERERLLQERQAKAQKAKKIAHYITENSLHSRHPYLSNKGFPDRQGLVYKDNLLIVPAYSSQKGSRLQLSSVQMIDSEGNKKYLKHGNMHYCFHRLGRGREHWICEGYVTGLSLHLALQEMYRNTSVWVAFSAHNLWQIAELPSLRHKPVYIAADHDSNGESQKYADKTSCPVFMPSVPDMDANDLHCVHGLTMLQDQLLSFLKEHQHERSLQPNAIR